MTQLSQQQTTQYATQAGFSGQGLQTIVAIAQCESGLRTDATNITGNKPVGSRDRGLVQINDYWHKEVTDTCAFDPACSMRQAYRISQNGTNFSQWATYNNGCYKQYMTSQPFTSTSNASSIPIVGGLVTGIQSSFTNFVEEAAIFILALTIIILGVMLLAGKQVGGIVEKAI